MCDRPVTPLSDFDLETFLPYRLTVLAGRISRDFARQYEQRFGLSRPEWRVLAHLSRSGTSSVREIHAEADLDKSRVSRAASKLEAAGLVVKQVHPADGRLVKLSLTDAGREVWSELAGMARDYQAELAQRMGPDWEAVAVMVDRLGTPPDG